MDKEKIVNFLKQEKVAYRFVLIMIIAFIMTLVVIIGTQCGNAQGIESRLPCYVKKLPDTTTQYIVKIDTVVEIKKVDTTWGNKVQVWLTPEEVKKLMEILHPQSLAIDTNYNDLVKKYIGDSVVVPKLSIDTINSRVYW